MIGPVANSVCIVAGAILGALCGPVLSQEFRKKIMNVFSCITLGIGVTMLSKGDSLPPVVLSLLLGTALGELTRFESLVMKGPSRRRACPKAASPKRCPRRCSAISSPWRRFSFASAALGSSVPCAKG